jgi:hypothetical protein
MAIFVDSPVELEIVGSEAGEIYDLAERHPAALTSVSSAHFPRAARI